MGINETNIKLDNREKEVAKLENALIKLQKSHIPFNRKQKETIYDDELHGMTIYKITELQNDLRTIDSYDISVVSKYANLIDTLFMNLQFYLNDCFGTKEFIRDDEVSENKLEMLINHMNTIDEKINISTNKDNIKVLELQKKQLFGFLDKHKELLIKNCSTFSIYDKKLNTKLIEILNTFEHKDYALASYLTISDVYDAHGKSNDVDINVFYPKEGVYGFYQYQNTNDFMSNLEMLKKECIPMSHSYTTNYFSNNFVYLNSFLEKLTKWRIEHYFSNISEYTNSMSNKTTSAKLPIPDEVLDVITKDFIKEKNSNKIKVYQNNIKRTI